MLEGVLRSLESFDNLPVQLGSYSGNLGMCSRGWEVHELEQHAARAVSSNNSLSRKKPLITLKDERDPWPWENSELILEVSTEKSLLQFVAQGLGMFSAHVCSSIGKTDCMSEEDQQIFTLNLSRKYFQG